MNRSSVATGGANQFVFTKYQLKIGKFCGFNFKENEQLIINQKTLF